MAIIERMRSALVAVTAAALLALPAMAAGVQPQTLVLQRADVPSGFQLDRDQSGPRTNQTEAKSDRRLRGLFERWGRITGYQADYYRKPEAAITSRADLYRSPEGPRQVMAWFIEEARRSGIKDLRRSPVRIGAEGWFYGGGSSTFNLVAWRHERVFAGLVVLGIGKTQTLALARVQQRRIAAALG